MEDDDTKITHELYDDVAVIKENSLELIQIKHSINEDNLTDRSYDFWKTISKWSNIIKTNPDNILEFIFYTNRSLSKISQCLLSELINDTKNYTTIRTFITKLFNELDKKEKIKKSVDSSNPIFKYVKDINNLHESEQKILFSKLTLVLSENTIIEDIKKRIKYFAIKKNKEIDSVYNELIGIVTDKRYDLAKKDKAFIVDYDYFRKELKFDLLIGLARIDDIDFDKYYSFENDYNDDYRDKIFYKQLKDIEIDDKKISDYAKERAKTSTFIDQLDLLPAQVNIINKKILDEWNIIHEDEYEEIYSTEFQHKKKARDCLKETKNANIEYQKQNLPRGLIVGKMIDLSNKPIIGWRKDWEEKYCE